MKTRQFRLIVAVSALFAGLGLAAPRGQTVTGQITVTAPFESREVGCGKPRKAPRPGKPTSADALLLDYEARGPAALVETVRTEAAFNDLLEPLHGSLEVWKLSPRRVQAVFLLDLAELGLRRRWFYWADVFDAARGYMLARDLRQGRNAEDDAFELLWHRTALALLSIARRPDLLEECGVKPLQGRIVERARAGEPAALIDPWITLQAGIVEESWTVVTPALLATRAPAALQAFEAAAAYPGTRQEALVRRARLLIRLRRYPEAVAALDQVGVVSGDAFVRYWASLFRGAALQGAGDVEGASRAYEDALAQAPGAQSPLVGLMTLAFARNDLDEAERRAGALKSSPVPTQDPWWEYSYADRRFLGVRFERLRGMVGK